MKSVNKYRYLANLLRWRFVKQYKVSKYSENLAEILKKQPKLVCIMNHDSMVGPLAIFPIFVHAYIRFGGENRIPLGVAWRPFYGIPVLKYLIRFMTQVEHGLSLNECIEKMKDQGFTDLVIMPEGENCSYGRGELRPFLSPRFLEIAIKLNIPVLLVVHQGSDRWVNHLSISDRLLPLFRILPEKHWQQLQDTKVLRVPKFHLSRLKHFVVSFKLYFPKLTAAELSSVPEEKKQQLNIEADLVHHKMVAMMQEMS